MIFNILQQIQIILNLLQNTLLQYDDSQESPKQLISSFQEQILNYTPKYQKLEDIQAYATQHNLCPYYIAYTDDLLTDYSYFYEDLAKNIFYVKSYNNEFAAFIDEHIIHFRGDITRKHLEKFISQNNINKCQNPVFTSLNDIYDFQNDIAMLYVPPSITTNTTDVSYEHNTSTISSTIPDTTTQQATLQNAIKTLKTLTSKTNLQFGITTVLNKSWQQNPIEKQSDRNLWGSDIVVIKTNNTYQYIHLNIFQDGDINTIEDKLMGFYTIKHLSGIRDVKPQTSNQNYFYWKQFNERVKANLVLKEEKDGDFEEFVEQKGDLSRESKKMFDTEEYDKLRGQMGSNRDQ